MRSSNFSNIILVVITIFGLLTILNFNTITEAKESKPIKVAYKDLSPTAKKQVECLAQNIYHEAGRETREGQIAVALVTLNRLASGNYANDICGVVNQKTNGMCQFSWVCQPFFTTKQDNSLYNSIRDLAVYVIMNYDNMKDVTHGATYYHADYVNPQWGLPKTTQIGRHIFYKRYTDTQTMKKEIKI